MHTHAKTYTHVITCIYMHTYTYKCTYADTYTCCMASSNSTRFMAALTSL